MKLSTFSLHLVLVAITTLRSGTATPVCPLVDSTSFCPQGCWHGSGITFSNGSRQCEPVGTGYFSPRNDDGRYPCAPGTFSNMETAEVCVSCPAGTHASVEGMDTCHVCPSSTYSAMPRSTSCSLCDPTHYSGDGANSVQVWNGNIYCVLSTIAPEAVTITASPTASPSKAPSNAPTHSTTAPTDAPFAIPSTNTPSPTFTSGPGESGAPTATNNSTNNGSIGGDDGLNGNSTLNAFPFTGCAGDDEFEWHGSCRQCPSTLSAMLHPVWIFLFLATVISLLCYLPPCCIGIFWLGLEYLQYLYLLGLTPLSWTAILQKTFGILSIFALDLDASFSLQCLIDNFDISPTGDQILMLCLPVLVWMILCAISRLLSTEGIPITRWATIGLYLGYAKLLLTSLEAIRCTPSSWFCRDQLFASIVGVLGIVGYGVGFPVWFLWNLRRSANEKSSYGWMQTTFPFQTTCWWWIGFWMVRKAVIVVLIAIFHDQSPTIILTTLLVALMLSEILQRSQPTAATAGESNKCSNNQGKDDDESSSYQWLQAPNVDLTLQSCMILLTALSFVCFAVSVENALGLGIFFLVVFIPSMIYWILALCHCHFSCQCCDKDKSTGSGVTMENEYNKTMNMPKRSIQSAISMGDGEAPTELSSPIFVPPSLSMVPHPGSSDEDYDNIDNDVDLEEADTAVAARDDDVDNRASLAGWTEIESEEDRVAVTHSDLSGSLDKRSISRQSSKNTLDGVIREDNSHPVIFDDDMTLSSQEEGEDNASLEEIWIDEATGLPVDPRTGDWTDAGTGFRATTSYNNETDQNDVDHDEIEYEDISCGEALRTQQWADKMGIQVGDDDEYSTETTDNDNGDTLALEPYHRAEPFTWGVRQSAAYQPSSH
jgi:hypothetical protein